MGKKAKYRKMLRQPAATQPSRESAPVARDADRRLADRERMKRVLWKMVERYEAELGGDKKPCVSGSQAIAAMKLLRELEREEDEQEEITNADVDRMFADSRERMLALPQLAPYVRKEAADAATG